MGGYSRSRRVRLGRLMGPPGRRAGSGNPRSADREGGPGQARDPGVLGGRGSPRDSRAENPPGAVPGRAAGFMGDGPR